MKKGSVFMKNAFKLIGIIALTAVIGFSLIACDSAGAGDTNKNVIGGGDEDNGPEYTVARNPASSLDLKFSSDAKDAITAKATQLKYVSLIAVCTNGAAAGKDLIAASSIDEDGYITGVKLLKSDGTLDVKTGDILNLSIWVEDGKSYKEFTGGDKDVDDLEFTLYFVDTTAKLKKAGLGTGAGKSWVDDLEVVDGFFYRGLGEGTVTEVAGP
jgi:hypothetical protein